MNREQATALSQRAGELLPQGMAGLNFIPANVLQDAIALSAPVQVTDEPTLVQYILNGIQRGQNYKEILNSLHGINGHSASLWKDYYLENKGRIDTWVTMCQRNAKEKNNQQQAASEDKGPVPAVKKPAIKKPSPASFNVDESPERPIVPAKRPRGRPKGSTNKASAPPKASTSKAARTKEDTPVAALSHATGSRRATLNSLTAPTAVFNSHLPPPNADIKIPDPPSRSPSPPTRVIPLKRGNKYTDEDREFFIKFIHRSLIKDNTLTRHELCERIAEKAPHHTTQSWLSHWSNNHDLPDKLLSQAHEKMWQTGNTNAVPSEGREEPKPKRPRYRDLSASEDDDDDNGNDEEDDEISNASDSDDGVPVRHWDKEDMGGKGEPFTDADMYMVAKRIARYQGDWEAASMRERWDSFAKKHPQRSDKSWQQYYRNNEKQIKLLVEKIRKENSQSESQRVRPTKALPRLKRQSDAESS
ncbi:hypothetical protein DFP72DRAFT_866981 [Ephemerocybe angulata]|uniref:Uncharacterized protein n=1 Tax=Ephemerocybe angulata TaxID=980116 RepID=A0A8H6IJ72_9AGAR|nr:hypothetical protein DFP72DRAFT_866981 [Tulosesus angulatus]